MANYVDGVLENCDVCRGSDKAPHVPIAGTSTVSMFSEKVQPGLLVLGDIIVLHAMDMFSKYTPPLPAQPENLLEVWDVFCGGRLGAFGPPKSI